MVVKRLADDDSSSSDGETRPKKIFKAPTAKPTDLLAGPSSSAGSSNSLRKKIAPLVRPKSSNNSAAGSSAAAKPPPASTVTTNTVDIPTTNTATNAAPAAKPALGGLSLLGSYSDSSPSDSD